MSGRGVSVKLGDTVELLGAQSGKVGVVKFIGETKFASGKWLGIVLSTATGKNNGCVQGVTYFTCRPNHGLFVKPSMCKLAEGKPEAADSSSSESSAPASASKIRHPSGGHHSSSTKLKKSPSDASSSSHSSRHTSKAESSTTTTTERKSSVKDRKEKSHHERSPSKIASSSSHHTPVKHSRQASSVSHAPKSSSSHHHAGGDSADHKKYEKEIASLQKAKEHAEAKAAEASNEALSLKEKVKRQTQTMMELKKAEMKAIGENKKLTEKISTLEDMIENLSVDKDLAAEEAMDAQLEVETLKEQLEHAQLEMQLIQQTKELDHEEMIKNLPSDQAEVARMQQQITTLTDALRQLRDLSVAEKNRFESSYEQQKRTIAKLSGEAALLKEAQSELEKAKVEVEELKEALDDAETYEQMVEEMSDKNLSLSEELDQMKERVSTLQEMVDTADEIEEGHQEYEQQLQLELNQKDVEVSQVKQKLHTANAKIDDLQKTVNQFRTLTSRLQEQMEALNEDRMDTANRSKDEISRSKDAFARMMKLQQHMGNLRKQALEFGLGELKAELAKQRLDFVKMYIPDNLAIDESSLDFLALLKKADSKAVLAIQMLDRYYGPQVSIMEQGSEEATKLCSFSARASDLLAQLQSTVHSLYRGMCEADSENFTAASNKHASLDRIEASLDEFLNLITTDSISPMTSLKPLQESVELVRDFAKRYFGNIPMDVLPQADTVRRIELSMTSVKIAFETVKANMRVISDKVSVVTLSEEASEEIRQQIKDALGGMEDSEVKCATYLDGIVERIGVLMKKPYYKEVGSLSDALRRAVNNAAPMPERASQLMSAVQHANGDGTVMSRLLTTEVSDRVGLANRLAALADSLEALSGCLDERIQTSDRSGVSGEGAGTKPTEMEGVWTERAMATKNELSEAASVRLKLEESNQAIQGKSRELFQANKKTREYKAKLDALTKRLQLVEDKAGGSAVLAAEVNEYRQKESEYQESMDIMQKDLEKYMKDNAALKKKVAKFALEQSRVGKNLMDGMGGSSMSGSVAQGEVQLLRQAIRGLRQQLADVRSQSVISQLERTLPPLPALRSSIHAKGQHTAAQNLSHRLREERTSKRELYRKKVFTRLEGDIAKVSKKLTHFRSNPVLVDLSEGHTAARRKYLAAKSELATVQSQTTKLKSTLYSVIGVGPTGQGSVDPQSAASSPMASSVLVGRVKLPGAEGTSAAEGECKQKHKLILGHAELTQLQALFV